MRNGISTEIKSIIENAPGGTIFATKDFQDMANLATIRKVLGREAEKGTIKRIIDGFYEKPQYSQLLQEDLPTDPDKVAYAIAKQYHWNIAPCGDIALNRLGLSTQVPVVWTYVSDGPYRDFQCGGNLITFKHRSNRAISGKSELTLLTTEALKSLGQNRVDDKVINILKKRIPDSEKPQVLAEAAGSSEWIYEIIRKVCE